MLTSIIILVIELICISIYLLILIKKKNKTKVSDSNLSKRLLKYMKPHWYIYVTAVLLICVEVVIGIIIPYLSGLSLEEVGNETINYKKIIFYFVLSLSLLVIKQVIQYFRSIMMNRTANKVVYIFRQEIYSHIQSFSHEQLHQIPTGSLVTRVTSDTTQLSSLYQTVVLNLVQYFVTIFGVLIAMFLLNVRLSLLILDVAPIIVLITIIFSRESRKVHRKVRNEVTNMNAFLSENITGVKITQIFNQEKKKYNEFSNQNEKLFEANQKEIFATSLFRPSIYLIYILTVFLIIYTGSTLNINSNFINTISYSTLYVFYQYISRFFNPIQSLADSFNTLQSEFASSEKVFKVLDTKPMIVDDPNAIDIDLKGHIEFKNVWFAYEGEDWIIKDISFEIKPDETIVFVGATGAGKTTILQLITRCFDIQKGQILIDGIDIKKIKLSSLRSQVGQMLQDVFLFSGTIADNIRLNDENISDEMIKRACDEVNASYFINKNEKGLEQEVLERGNNFSSGEKQLISFARTIVHNPKLIILDEATSNIDTETELIIQKTLNNVISKHTTIMVAHRLSTIQHADRIYVFEKGHILESGSHQELLKKQGRYYKLYKLQYEKAS